MVPGRFLIVSLPWPPMLCMLCCSGLQISSLSVEEHAGSELLVSVFEVEATPKAVAAFIQREHEFRFVVVRPEGLEGGEEGSAAQRAAVMCARNTDEAYRAARCPPAEWERRYAKHGLTHIWRCAVHACLYA